PEAGGGSVREVHGHDRRSPPIEGERGGQHAPIPNRDEFGDPVLGLILEHVNRIEPTNRWLPRRVARSGSRRARRLARGCALSRRCCGVYREGVRGFGGRAARSVCEVTVI